MSELPVPHIPELVECCAKIEALESEVLILKQQVAVLIAAQNPAPP